MKFQIHEEVLELHLSLQMLHKNLYLKLFLHILYQFLYLSKISLVLSVIVALVCGLLFFYAPVYLVDLVDAKLFNNVLIDFHPLFEGLIKMVIVVLIHAFGSTRLIGFGCFGLVRRSMLFMRLFAMIPTPMSSYGAM